MLILSFWPVLAQETEEPEVEETYQTVVVTATKQEKEATDVPASVSLITSEILAEKGITMASQELVGVPGVFFRRQDAADTFMSINIRGLTGNHGNDTFLALLDGIPFVSAHEEVLLGEIPFGAVDRVEVVRGPSSALYGRGALSGAINYLTRETTSQHSYDLTLTGGSFGYARPHLSANIPLVADTNHLLVDAYYETSDGWRDNTERETRNILLKNEMIISDNTRLIAYLNYYDNEQGAGGQIPLDARGNVLATAGGREGFIGYDPNEYDRSSLMGTLRLNTQINDNLEFQATVNYRDMEDNNRLNFFDPFGYDPDNNILRVNGFEGDRQTETLFIEPQLVWQSGRHNLVMGASFERVELDETNWWTGQNGFNFDTFDFYFYEINIDFTTGQILNRDNPFWVTRNETYRGDSTNTFNGFYIQDDIQLSERLSLTLGARYDRFERDAQIDSDVDFDGTIDNNPELNDDEDNIAPKVALLYRWQENHSVYANYGEGFNSNFAAVWQWDPSLYQRGNDVQPSEVTNYELGFKGQGRDFMYSVALYELTQDDRLVFISDPTQSGPPIATTADEFRSRGLEVETRFRIADGWQIHAAYAYTDAKWQDYNVGGNDYTGNRPTGVPENTYNLGLSGQISRDFAFSTWLDGASDYAITLDNQVEGGSFDVWNASISYRPRGGSLASIQLVGRNILDEDYYYYFGSNIPSTAQPGLPANLQLSMKLNF
jgi:iron complex outermembrane receptor protein